MRYKLMSYAYSAVSKNINIFHQFLSSIKKIFSPEVYTNIWPTKCFRFGAITFNINPLFVPNIGLIIFII